jgi:hypothetical protein
MEFVLFCIISYNSCEFLHNATHIIFFFWEQTWHTFTHHNMMLVIMGTTCHINSCNRLMTWYCHNLVVLWFIKMCIQIGNWIYLLFLQLQQITITWNHFFTSLHLNSSTATSWLFLYLNSSRISNCLPPGPNQITSAHSGSLLKCSSANSKKELWIMILWEMI